MDFIIVWYGWAVYTLLAKSALHISSVSCKYFLFWSTFSVFSAKLYFNSDKECSIRISDEFVSSLAFFKSSSALLEFPPEAVISKIASCCISLGSSILFLLAIKYKCRMLSKFLNVLNKVFPFVKYKKAFLSEL